jgi:hypothetical protein
MQQALLDKLSVKNAEFIFKIQNVDSYQSG